MPLGYEVAIFEKLERAGGLMRTNIPAFRLPPSVLDEEIDMILDMGVDIRYNTPIDEHEGARSTEGFDAVFVGTGAPKGKNLDIPGRDDTRPRSTSASTGSSRSPSATSTRSASAS